MTDLTTEQMMLALIALSDGECSLRFSEHTKKWYVNTPLCWGNKSSRSHESIHEKKPEQAVRSFFRWLVDPPEGCAVVKENSYREVSYWRWNGGAFTRTQEPE